MKLLQKELTVLQMIRQAFEAESDDQYLDDENVEGSCNDCSLDEEYAVTSSF